MLENARKDHSSPLLQESKVSFLCLLDRFVLLGRFGRFAAHSGARIQTATGREGGGGEVRKIKISVSPSPLQTM